MGSGETGSKGKPPQALPLFPYTNPVAYSLEKINTKDNGTFNLIGIFYFYPGCLEGLVQCAVNSEKLPARLLLGRLGAGASVRLRVPPKTAESCLMERNPLFFHF